MRIPMPFHKSTVAAKDRLAGPSLGRCVGNTLLMLTLALPSDLRTVHRHITRMVTNEMVSLSSMYIIVMPTHRACADIMPCVQPPLHFCTSAAWFEVCLTKLLVGTGQSVDH